MRCRPTLWFSNDGTFSYSRDHPSIWMQIFGGDQNLLPQGCLCGTGFGGRSGLTPDFAFQGSRAQTVRGWRTRSDLLSG